MKEKECLEKEPINTSRVKKLQISIIIAVVILLVMTIVIIVLVLNNKKKLIEKKTNDQIVNLLYNNYIFWNLFCSNKFVYDSSVTIDNIKYNKVNYDAFNSLSKISDYINETYLGIKKNEVNNKIRTKLVEYDGSLYVMVPDSPTKYDFSDKIKIIKEYPDRMAVTYEIMMMDIYINNGKYQLVYSPFECNLDNQ